MCDAAISGGDSDPDHDGIRNLLECALGLHPKTADTSGLPTAASASGYLTFTYRQNKEATDLIFTPQIAPSLDAPWSAAGLTEIGREDKGSYWLVTVRDDSPLTSHSCRFMRLQVTTPE